MELLPKRWFKGNALELAPKLLGKIVWKGECAGIITETEAYMSDAASHGAKFTARGASMRETYGQWYVYFTYGVHWCANVTTDAKGTGAVLIRAVEPLSGIAAMQRRRSSDDLANLASGPAKFCQAFGITGVDNGAPLSEEFGIYNAPTLSPREIGVSPRIGISLATDLPWRFYIKDNPFVSRRTR
jgi:DNA-3-methyladenine glycosylase